MADGHLNKCKICCRFQAKHYRIIPSYREKIRTRDWTRFQAVKGTSRLIELQRRRRAHYPERYKARNLVNNAIRDGRLIREPCEICGEKAEAHHPDYQKPLEIRWLCFKHHRELKHGHIVGVL
jgi:hypothetical protein